MNEKTRWFVFGWISLLVLINLLYIVVATISLGSLRCALVGCTDSGGFFSLGVLLFDVVFAVPILVVAIIGKIRGSRRRATGRD